MWRYYGEAFDKYRVPVTVVVINGEFFVEIPGTNGAKVSNMGRVLTPFGNNRFYKVDEHGNVCITIDGVRTHRRVAVLVVQAFVAIRTNTNEWDSGITISGIVGRQPLLDRGREGVRLQFYNSKSGIKSHKTGCRPFLTLLFPQGEKRRSYSIPPGSLCVLLCPRELTLLATVKAT